MSDRGQWGCIGAVLAAIIGGVFLIASVVISQERTRQAQAEALATIGVLETQIAAQRHEMAASGSLIEVTRIVEVTTAPLPAPPPAQMPVTVTVLVPAPSEASGSRASIPAAPAPEGGVLYQADWSNGQNGWPATLGWKVLNGELLNDGTSAGGGNWKSNWIASPAPARDNIAVQAEMRLVREPGCGSFGIVLREAYEAGIHLCGDPVASLRSKDGDVIEERKFTLAENDWHVYRFEADGNVLKFLVDGAVVLEAMDNRYLSGGQAGLFSDRTQISVRTFQAMAP